MTVWTLIGTLVFSILLFSAEEVRSAVGETRLPIVFVYTVVPAVCQFGLPEYIQISVEQSIFTQPDCDVYLLSNIGECQAIADSVKAVTGLHIVDSVPIVSDRTRQFHNLSTGMFARDYGNELWITSALRFFMLEDLMIQRNWTELLHVEADNLLYGRFTAILPQLRSLPLAATPLNAHKTFITASVFWVAAQKHIIDFNNYLLALGSNTDQRWTKYLDWLRLFPNCCKNGGVNPDSSGNGIKPFAINEMSMLAYYHEIEPTKMRLLPVIPHRQYNLNRYIVDLHRFMPGGKDVEGLVTGVGIWDSNSWGQFLGGTSAKKGKDKHFSDASHISGQAIRTNFCRVHMLCGNMTEFGYALSIPALAEAPHAQASHTIALEGVKQQRCYTAPFVRCGGEPTEHDAWIPLWNLHVHSKHTGDVRSHLCPCNTSMSADYFKVGR